MPPINQLKKPFIMLTDDLDKVNNLLERKRNYENCIKALRPHTCTKSILNYKTNTYETVEVRCFAQLDRIETNKSTYECGRLDEKAEALLLPVFERLLEEVEQEIAAVSINGIPGKESEVKTMLSEEIQPMFKEPSSKDVKKMPTPAWTKWLTALAIGFVLLLLLNFLQ